MTRNSRLSLDPSTHLPSINSFGELSQFLRGAIADEDTRLFSDSMSSLASHIEALIAGLRLGRQRSRLAPALMDMLTALRTHRTVVVGLGVHWRALYEYAAYLQALNNFRVLIGQWLLDGGPGSPELPVGADDFQLVAWRTLGEGLLLIDMYEQCAVGDPSPDASSLASLDEPQVERAMAWWKKLRL